MKTQRKRHSPESKAKVALEAIKGQNTMNEIAAKYGRMGEDDPRKPTAFARDGFIVLDRFLEPRELAGVRTAVDALVASCPASFCSRLNNTLLPLRWNDRIVRLFLESERRMRALMEGLSAADLKWISGYVSIKEARSPALWWHQDWWCWDHPVSYRRAAPQVAVLCYLTATDGRNGALRVLPGSHQRSSPLHATLPEPHAATAIGLKPGHSAMSDHAGQETVSLKAGYAVAIDYRLLHGTHANASASRRDCILLSFTPSWRDLPDDVRGHLIRHPAQPADGERLSGASWEARLLPQFHGLRADLPVNRHAPSLFAVTE